MTYDGATLRVYVGGAQVASRAVTGALQTSTGALRIGGNAVWGGEFFSGRLDELRVYNRALTAAEVAADVTRPVGPGEPPRLAVTPASLAFSGGSRADRSRRRGRSTSPTPAAGRWRSPSPTTRRGSASRRAAGPRRRR